MSIRARRWMQRSPRYILRPDDNQFVRFAHQQNTRKAMGTQIIDISESGLAFLVNRANMPRVGETIMIEFEVPGKEQMACYSRVVRIEEVPRRDLWKYPERNVIVAVTFLNLPRGQRKQLHHGLNEKFAQLRAQYERTKFREKMVWFRQHLRTIVMYAACILALIYIFYFLTQPRGNYTKFQTVPWGSRKF